MKLVHVFFFGFVNKYIFYVDVVKKKVTDTSRRYVKWGWRRK